VTERRRVFSRSSLFRPTVLLALGLLVPAAAPGFAQRGTAPIDDREYWRLITDLSEPGGVFSPQLMSNEDSAQFVVPALTARVERGGVYLGVGSEQNFTYLAALEPRLAFVVDIRRENMLEMLMYQAVFELSADRADFVSRLFSRTRPAGLSDGSTVEALFAAYAEAPADASVLEKHTQTVLDTLTHAHGWPLAVSDQAAITRMLAAFSAAGPQGLKGFGDRDNLSYAQLMAAGDLAGVRRGFLASEASYRRVRQLERQNRVIPVVGDFAGEKALAAIAQYLKTSRAALNVFYVSNVERYLFEPGGRYRQFYANVAAMPLDPSALFIRSVTRDISQRLGIPLPVQPTKWWTFLAPIRESLEGVTSGRVQTYRDLFVSDR
jgi:hypothetical protein